MFDKRNYRSIFEPLLFLSLFLYRNYANSYSTRYYGMVYPITRVLRNIHKYNMITKQSKSKIYFEV